MFIEKLSRKPVQKGMPLRLKPACRQAGTQSSIFPDFIFLVFFLLSLFLLLMQRFGFRDDQTGNGDI
ncbi:hypothetical protein [Agriterribacter sp.]|uniref:hypothetical protein n=1 Tax=Agriterribacter sp. TaxID=2821509 RepID=UPI002D1FAEE9|nr:hypothetical protein [Agriterribacter sp.]